MFSGESMLVRIVVIEFREAVSEYKLAEALYTAFGRQSVKIHQCSEDMTIQFERK